MLATRNLAQALLRAGIAALVALAGISAAWGATIGPYSLTSTGQIGASSISRQSWNEPGQSAPVYNSPFLTFNDPAVNYGFQYGTVGESGTAWAKAGANPNETPILQAFLEGALNGADSTVLVNLNAHADIQPHDILTFGGQPYGYQDVFLLTITLNSGISGDPYADAGYPNSADALMKAWTSTGDAGLTLVNNNGVPLSGTGNANTVQTVSEYISGRSGLSYDLYYSLSANLQLTEHGLNVGGRVDASNTGAVSLVPVTPGATFTSASGLSYAPFVENAPEPGSFWLSGTALVAILLRMRRRRQKQIT